MDPDCLTFSEQEVCLKCKDGYYMNKNTDMCMELPPFCVKAGIDGKCSLCKEGYNLLTSYECEPVSNISNCLIQSKIDKDFCESCKKGYYVEKGRCE